MTETETNGTTTSAVSPFTFQSTTFEIVDRDGQPWLRLPQIGAALGYKRHDILGKLYRSNADEFTDSMTTVVKLPDLLHQNGVADLNRQIDDSGQLRDIRIFSLRGAYLLGMFARTPIAKAFRVWVLDLLEKYGQPQPVASLAPYSVHPGQTLSEDQAQTLRAMLDEFVKTLPKEKQGGFMVKGWAKLKAHFGVGYREIPAAKFTDAVSIIARHIVEYSAPALEAPKQAELDFSIVSFKNQRLLHTIDHEGREHIQRMRNDQMLADFDEFAMIIKDHFLMPSMKQLASIVSAGVEAMAKRSGYGKPDPIPA